MPTARLSRRQVLTGGAAGLGLLGLGGGIVASVAEAGRPDPVRSVTVAYTASGQRMGLEADEARDLPASSRVMPDLADPGPARRQQDFLDGCAPWLAALPAQRRESAVSALLDLWVLSDELPATVAGGVGPWRYIWARDAAFAAVAFSRIGFAELGWKQLLHLQSLQAADGSFAARVIPETGLAPDDRQSQFDSLGLVLWSISEVHSASTAGGEPFALGDLRRLLRLTSDRLIDHTGHGRSLPPAGPDYWEVVESRVTLGLAAPTLVGLGALAGLCTAAQELGDHLGEGADAVPEIAETFASTFARTFGANGLQRYPTSGGPDSAIAYLALSGAGAHDGSTASATGHGPRADPPVLESPMLAGVWDRLEQPAGGIKPGHGWIIDRSSWTPSTSLMGLGFARLGDVERGEAVLDWLSANRTVAGSYPEKISADGRAVSVAPLSWTAANVIITLDELYGPSRGGGG
ncbi:hypothetical protein [Brevibacterium atlanticum]|uniref:hypothetical protein n=1 Tax=Brevibacterium atlanticum TaxID=2697563 RepID=UPI001424488B|nr:hypothetical protein [Brevibacterium atlanticum]